MIESNPERDPYADPLLDGLTAKDDASFLAWVTPYLADLLAVDYVLTGVLVDSSRDVVAYAGWDRVEGRFIEFEAPLRNSPGAHVFDRLSCIYPQDITSLFPRDQWLVDHHAESYVGLPLWDADDQPLGNLVAISRRSTSIEEQHRVVRTLERFRSRISHALESERLRRVLERFPKRVLASRGEERLLALLRELAHVTRIGTTFCVYRPSEADPARIVAVDDRGRSVLTDTSEPERNFLLDLVKREPVAWSEREATRTLGMHAGISAQRSVGFGAMRLDLSGCSETGAIAAIGWLHPRRLPADVRRHPLVRFTVPFVESEIAELIDDGTRQRELHRESESQRRESLGALVGGVAHDFNNLLLGVLGYADLLRQKSTLDPESRDYAERIIHASRRAADICQQLLAYSGKRHIRQERLDLTPLVERVVTSFRESLPHRHQIDELYPKEPLPIAGDQGALEQAVRVLLENALEALDEGTNGITVQTGRQLYSRDQLDRLRLGAECAPGEYVTIEVTDTGRGIPATEMGRIFEPFYTTKAYGRGLGLAAVLGIVESHRGAIEVSSKPGRGTTVRLLVPKRLDEVVSRPKPSGSVSGENRSGRLLVVDPDPAGRRWLRGILGPAGYEVTEHAEVTTAIEALDERRFDAVVVDFASVDEASNDGEDGLGRLVTAIRHLPVVALIDIARPAARSHLEALDRFRAMTTPVEAAPLIATVESLLARPSHEPSAT